jgi:hypothetical protein
MRSLQAGDKMTDDELWQFDPLQFVAFDSGFNAGRSGQSPDREFDYHRIKQTVKKRIPAWSILIFLFANKISTSSQTKYKRQDWISWLDWLGIN